MSPAIGDAFHEFGELLAELLKLAALLHVLDGILRLLAAQEVIVALGELSADDHGKGPDCDGGG